MEIYNYRKPANPKTAAAIQYILFLLLVVLLLLS
jgi:hypothetical protein